MVFERGFATQTLSQRPKVKPLLRKGFTFGLLKFASLTRTDVKLDSFIFDTSRLFTKLGESQARNDAATETLLQAVTRLTQSQEAQWQAIREM